MEKANKEDKLPTYAMIALIVFGVLALLFLCAIICKRK
jgi:hypothetical protein